MHESVWCEMDNAPPGAKNSRNKKLETAQPSSTMVVPAPGSALTRCAMLKLPISLSSDESDVSKIPLLIDTGECEAEREAIEESEVRIPMTERAHEVRKVAHDRHGGGVRPAAPNEERLERAETDLREPDKVRPHDSRREQNFDTVDADERGRSTADKGGI